MQAGKKMLHGSHGKPFGTQRRGVACRSDVVQEGGYSHITGNAREKNTTIRREWMKNQTGLHSRMKSLSRCYNTCLQRTLFDRWARRFVSSRNSGAFLRLKFPGAVAIASFGSARAEITQSPLHG